MLSFSPFFPPLETDLREGHAAGLGFRLDRAVIWCLQRWGLEFDFGGWQTWEQGVVDHWKTLVVQQKESSPRAAQTPSAEGFGRAAPAPPPAPAPEDTEANNRNGNAADSVMQSSSKRPDFSSYFVVVALPSSLPTLAIGAVTTAIGNSLAALCRGYSSRPSPGEKRVYSLKRFAQHLASHAVRLFL